MSYCRNWWDLISISLELCCSLRPLSCFCIKPVRGIPGDEFLHWESIWVWVGGRKRVNEDGQISLLFREAAEKEGISFGLMTYSKGGLPCKAEETQELFFSSQECLRHDLPGTRSQMLTVLPGQPRNPWKCHTCFRTRGALDNLCICKTSLSKSVVSFRKFSTMRN